MAPEKSTSAGTRQGLCRDFLLMHASCTLLKQRDHQLSPPSRPRETRCVCKPTAYSLRSVQHSDPGGWLTHGRLLAGAGTEMRPGGRGEEVKSDPLRSQAGGLAHELQDKDADLWSASRCPTQRLLKNVDSGVARSLCVRTACASGRSWASHTEPFL